MIIALALLLTILIGFAAFVWFPTSIGILRPSATLEPEPSPSPTVGPTATQTSAPTSSPNPDTTSTSGSPVEHTAVPAITPTRRQLSATVVPPSEAHFWLDRPVGPDSVDTVARFYPYGSRGDGTYPIHHGVEFVNPIGTSLRAVGEGTVIAAGDDLTEVYGAYADFYGMLVILRLDDTYQGVPIFAVYGHLSRVDVEIAQRVKEGDIIGEVGDTGVAMGPHLHFEVRLGQNLYSSTRNPELWLKPLPGHGAIVGQLHDDTGRPVSETVITVHRAEEPEAHWRETHTYPTVEVNPDDDWQENFAMGDVPVGRYVLRARHNDQLLSARVKVEEGSFTFAVLRP